jgi:hypothetical protein
MNMSFSHPGNFESMRNLEMTIQERSINRGSKAIQNVDFVRDDSTETTSYTHIAEKDTRSVISVSEGITAAIPDIT